MWLFLSKLLDYDKLCDFFQKNDWITTNCVTFFKRITKLQQTVKLFVKRMTWLLWLYDLFVITTNYKLNYYKQDYWQPCEICFVDLSHNISPLKAPENFKAPHNIASSQLLKKSILHFQNQPIACAKKFQTLCFSIFFKSTKNITV